MGGVYDAGNKISKFANGGIVKKPTLFPMAQGMGLMGEAAIGSNYAVETWCKWKTWSAKFWRCW